MSKYLYLMNTVRKMQTSAIRNEFNPILFVGNLPWTVGDKELSQYFSQFGKVVEAKVHFDSVTQQSRQFGYVAFIHRAGYDNALIAKVHLLEGRLLKVEPSSKIDMSVRNKVT